MAAETERRGIRAALARSIGSIPFLRRFTVRRMLKFIEKSKAKGRPLPPQLAAIDAQLSRVPVKDRRAALEAALRMEREGATSREQRRAVERQERRGESATAAPRSGGGRPAGPPRAAATGRGKGRPASGGQAKGVAAQRASAGKRTPAPAPGKGRSGKPSPGGGKRGTGR